MVEEKGSIGKVKTNKGLYSFQIEGFSGLANKIGESTESPEFELCGKDYLWQLRIFPGGSLEAHKGYISFYLASKSLKSARASYKLIVVNQEPGGIDETFASSGVRLFEAKGVQIDGWGRDKFMTSAILNDIENGFINNDTVIFKVEIIVYGELEPTIPVVNNLGDSAVPSLSKCMKKMLIDQNSSDINLIVSTDKINMSAHRCILSSRSPVFYAMLKSGMNESSSGLIIIPDIEEYVMKELLLYIYTDSLSDPVVLDNIAEELLCAACKYQIIGLISICESYLSLQFTIESVVYLLKLGDSLGAYKLKENALQFMVQNANAVIVSKDFTELENELFIETKAILDAASKRKGIRSNPENNERKFLFCTIM